MTGDPLVSVVVASHARPLRLRWLLNALEEQTLAPHEWEVVVVHDYDEATARRVLEAHPLGRSGRLRHHAIAPGSGSPPRQRNLGWRLARAPLVAFTDDDCRPEPDWLERLLAAAEAHPGAFVQGRTRSDRFEHDQHAAPHPRWLDRTPPSLCVETSNVLYPRALLERLGGFDERAIAGEDLDLAWRAKGTGAAHVAAPEAVVNHAVEGMSLPGILKTMVRGQHMALQVKLHPEVRGRLPLRVFWGVDHLLVLLAAAGLLAARRAPLAAALALPWVASEVDRRGTRPVDLAVNALELPGRTVRELAVTLIFAAGSVRYRTVLL